MRTVKTARVDYILLSAFILLLVFGLLMLTSAGTAVGYDRFDDRYFFIKRQLLLGVLPGLIAFFILVRVPYALLRRSALPVFILSVILLGLVFVPGIGSTLNTNAQSWLVIAGQSFQPAEFAKLGLVFFLSLILGRMGEKIRFFRSGFLVALGLGLIPILFVIAQPDLGTATILFAILFAELFLAGANLLHISGLAIGGIAGIAVMIVHAPYRAARLMTFLHPELHPLGIGYHINQAFLAIGSGGWFGLGFNRSRQKFQYLPEVHADSIFAIIAEEMGFFIAAAMVALIIFIVLRSLQVAKAAPDPFGRFLVSGIAVWFLVQSCMNIGAMVGVMPLTGVPLPFVSHGGTALMINLAAAGIILNVSKHRTV